MVTIAIVGSSENITQLKEVFYSISNVTVIVTDRSDSIYDYNSPDLLNDLVLLKAEVDNLYFHESEVTYKFVPPYMGRVRKGYKLSPLNTVRRCLHPT